MSSPVAIAVSLLRPPPLFEASLMPLGQASKSSLPGSQAGIVGRGETLLEPSPHDELALGQAGARCHNVLLEAIINANVWQCLLLQNSSPIAT